MRLPRLSVAAVVCSLLVSTAGPASHALEDEVIDVAAAVEDLVSGDDARRDDAIRRLKYVGPSAAVDLISPALRHAEGPAAEALRMAFVALGVEDCLGTLYAHQTTWPGNREGVEALLGELETLRDAKATTIVKLRPGLLEQPRRVPPFAETMVEGTIPAALAGTDCAVRVHAGRLEVDTRGDGRFATKLDLDGPGHVTIGTKRAGRRLALQVRLGTTYARSTSLLVGSFRGETIELLDVDLDGAFDGPHDLIAVGGEAFRRHAEGNLIHTMLGLARYRVVADDKRTTMSVTRAPNLPDANSTLLDAVDTLNGWRNRIGLPPLFIDLPRSRDCQLHVGYWEHNGYTGHGENRDNDGYTKEGARAGRESSTSPDSSPSSTIVRIARTVLHRGSLVGRARDGLGVGHGSWGSCIWGGAIDPRPRGFPIIVPGAGQVDVPRECRKELPAPGRDPAFYERPRGYPVAVYHDRLYSELANPRIELRVLGADDTPLDGDTFSPETPYGNGFASRGMTCFVADLPLRSETWYCARFTATTGDGPVDFSWTFVTE